MRFFVLFLHGPAAAGKHTIGSIVSERTGLPFFHNHLTVDLIKTLFDFGTEPFAELRETIWRAAFEAASREGKSFVFTFNPENSVDPHLLTDLDNIVQAHGGKVHYVELLCSDDEVVKRIDNASRHQFGKLTDANIYLQFRESGGFDFPPLPEPMLTIDTERMAPDEAAAAIAAMIDGSSGPAVTP